MADTTDGDFDALATLLTDLTAPALAAAEVSVEDDAAMFGRALMLQEHGSEPALRAAMKRPGRRGIGGSPASASPTARGRIPDAEFAAFGQLEHATGKGQSELVREAVHNLLVQHKLVNSW